MDRHPDLPAELQDNLVAYLDGELDESATQEIERTLSQSMNARRAVDELTLVWEMLDELPRQEASEAFTEKTLSTIRVIETEEAASPQKITRRLRPIFRVGSWAAGLLLAAAGGYFLTNRWVTDESTVLLRELPVIEKIDVYTEVNNVEFLVELQQSGLFDGEPKHDTR